ncbi:exopolygalacturonase isoform X2 [Spinacia oleracea]|uniref:Exopolygalacturonase isoform X2 n=1 Tax=Spinacia oleracea TaxID=3562 RepID=A0A9R0ICN3_SPIOL|nr:exopolygalacturonase isoform X2 [Spinacia oleracea]
MSRITSFNLYLLLCTIFTNTFCQGIIINVTSFRVRADGKTDDTRAFIAAWEKVCNSQGNVTLLIPKGTYLVGPLKLRGPCENVSSLTVLIKGYLKAKTDLSEYEFGSGWIEFAWINGLTLTGGGVFDGQGATAWPFNNCPTSSNCDLLPTNLKFVGMNRTVVDDITSLNSKFFHLALVECRDFNGSRLEISAPEDSPNTDGIHLERSSNVSFSWSNIGTGDDCISVGQGNSQITITNITCGPGHGISVGSLGKYPHEQDVNGLLVRNCTISGTSNGIRIKTWADSPGRSSATNMKFENIVMKHVRNPIIIDQAYCPFHSCSSQAPSRVRLSNIYFKNIRGTSLSQVAVTLSCSKGIPCKNIFLQNVHLNLISGERLPVSSCENVEARYFGIQMPPPCP